MDGPNLPGEIELPPEGARGLVDVAFLIAAEQEVAARESNNRPVSNATEVSHIARVVRVFVYELAKLIGGVGKAQGVKAVVIERVRPVESMAVPLVAERGDAIRVESVQERGSREGFAFAIVENIAVIQLAPSERP